MLSAPQTVAGTEVAGLVVPLDRLRAEDQPRVGAKAANLARLIHAGLPTPTGFCVTAAAYQQWFENCRAAQPILDRLEQLRRDQHGAVCQTAAELRQVLAANPLPKPIARAILDAWEQFDPSVGWAVRSSATVEDLPDASFAGQYETFLNTRGREALTETVRQCWISLFTDRAVLYRAAHKVSQISSAMAVVVQVMVPAEASGVLFTADPVTRDSSRMVIEGTCGLGEALVSGKVSPDRFVLDKRTLRVIERLVQRKTVQVLPEVSGGVREQPVAEAIQKTPCLTDDLARRLGELALQAERLFGGPQDLEWAISRRQVFLLQARPITTLTPPPGPEPDIWTNANALEAFPDVVTPMSWSLLLVLLNDFLHPIVRRLGVDTERRPMIGLIAGRAYINLRVLIDMMGGFSGPMVVDFTEAFGGLHAGLQDVINAYSRSKPRRFGLKEMVRFGKLLAWLLPRLPHQKRLIEEWRQRVTSDLANVDPAVLSDAALAAHAPALLELACRDEGGGTWAAATWMGIAAVGGSTAVIALARRWLGDTDGSLANRLLAGAGGMDSAENGLNLWRLAAWVRAHPPVARVVRQQGTFADLQAELATTPEGRDFLEHWEEFMRLSGHQARGGMDVYNPRWSEMPDFVLDMLRVFLGVDAAADPLALQGRRWRENQELIANCRKEMRNPLKRWFLAFLVRASRRGLTQRENIKNEGVRTVAIIRRALLEAGRRLVQRGTLGERDDIFFLQLDELRPVLVGNPTLDVASSIAQRKAEYSYQKTLTPPPVVVGQYDPERTATPTIDQDKKVLRGLAASPGVATGRARVILQANSAECILPGEILVAPYTDPGWSPYFLPAAAIVVDVGGLLSHGSVVAREYGLPAVVNVGPATQLIKTGQLLQVDGNLGIVRILA